MWYFLIFILEHVKEFYYTIYDILVYKQIFLKIFPS